MQQNNYNTSKAIDLSEYFNELLWTICSKIDKIGRGI